ncbi:hypothetical protein TNCV_3562911 [Trichonephila clavipes]|nr:hypothetical protein TNCV_3562911 [Trichonephila clavipes]
MDLTSRSPDVNPIEYIFVSLVKAISKSSIPLSPSKPYESEVLLLEEGYLLPQTQISGQHSKQFISFPKFCVCDLNFGHERGSGCEDFILSASKSQTVLQD